jgi:Domain of unknown function (DUF4359)
MLQHRAFKLSVFSLLVAAATLAVMNPGMPEYQRQILAPAAREHAVASDAMLASILSSLPSGAASETAASDGVSLLADRTVRHNYVVMSTYDTGLEFCPGSAARMRTQTVGIAGRFYTWSKGDCMSEDTHAR